MNFIFWLSTKFWRDLFADVMSMHNRNRKHTRAFEIDKTNLLAMLKLTIGSYVSVRSLRYKARGKFGEHERGKCLLTSGACTIGIWSTLAQLNLIRQIYVLCYNSYWPMLKVGSIRMGWLRLSEQENFTRSLHIMSVPRTHKLHIFMKQDYFLVFV